MLLLQKITKMNKKSGQSSKKKRKTMNCVHLLCGCQALQWITCGFASVDLDVKCPFSCSLSAVYTLHSNSVQLSLHGFKTMMLLNVINSELVNHRIPTFMFHVIIRQRYRINSHQSALCYLAFEIDIQRNHVGISIQTAQSVAL